MSALVGTMGALLAKLDISASLLVLAACGCYIGLPFARPMGAGRAVLVFAGSSLICAKAGAVLGAAVVIHWPAMAAAGDIAGLIATGLGLMFHPLLSGLAQALPSYLSRRAA